MAAVIEQQFAELRKAADAAKAQPHTHWPQFGGTGVTYGSALPGAQSYSANALVGR